MSANNDSLVGKTVEVEDEGRGEIIEHYRGFVSILLEGEDCRMIVVRDSELNLNTDAE